MNCELELSLLCEVVRGRGQTAREHAHCGLEVFLSRRRWFFNAAASAGVAENLPAYAQGGGSGLSL